MSKQSFLSYLYVIHCNIIPLLHSELLGLISFEGHIGLSQLFSLYQIIIMTGNTRPHHDDSDTMTAVVWEGKPFEVATKQVAKPKIIDERDAIVRITTTAICGTDLHIYHGVLGSEEVPWMVGHEGMGIVVEIGSAVTSIKEGDRVVISAVQAPGHLQLEPTIGGGAPIFGGGKDWGDLGGTLGTLPSIPTLASQY